MMSKFLFLAAGAALLSLIAGACGDGGPASLPETGAAVCNDLKEAERFRYVLDYSIQSPQQESPPDDSAAAGQWYLLPSLPPLDLQLKHDGAMVKPDRLDFDVSQPNLPTQPSLRTIRIGEAEWLYLGDSWQVNSEPHAFAFTPPNLCDQLVSPLNLNGASVSEESVGDTETRHVHVEGTSLEASSQIFSPQSDMGRALKTFNVDLWLSKNKNRLVKVAAVSSATLPFGRELSVSFDLELRSYNDKDIKIEPPI